MEEYLTKLINNVAETQQNLPVLFAQVAQGDSAELVDLNVDQLRRGISSTGEPITPSYESDVYADFKQSIGSEAPLGTPDLILEGDFTGDFYTEQKGDQILFDSKDPKTPELNSKYENIFTLTPENKEEYLEDNSDKYINTIENEIFKGTN